jgi:hypothetical protein
VKDLSNVIFVAKAAQCGSRIEYALLNGYGCIYAGDRPVECNILGNDS